MITGVIGLFFLLFSIALAVAATIFWIWMLIDCIKNKLLSDTEKIVWVLVMIFTHCIGALIYFFAGRKG